MISGSISYELKNILNYWEKSNLQFNSYLELHRQLVLPIRMEWRRLLMSRQSKLRERSRIWKILCCWKLLNWQINFSFALKMLMPSCFLTHVILTFLRKLVYFYLFRLKSTSLFKMHLISILHFTQSFHFELVTCAFLI